jgi:ribosomal protein L40E
MNPAVASRAAALPALEQVCPRCAARRSAGASHCIECGLRLPDVHGTVPALRRRWVRHFGWYPGDWIWLPLLGLGVAVAATAVAFVVARHRTHAEPAVLVATSAANAAQASSGSATPANGRLTWPAGRTGWTIVISSYPQPKGRRAATAAAARAAAARLPQVGTLDSSRYASLHAGYTVVFSGIFTSSAEARTALGRVRHAGFSGSYPSLIAP